MEKLKRERQSALAKLQGCKRDRGVKREGCAQREHEMKPRDISTQYHEWPLYLFRQEASLQT